MGLFSQFVGALNRVRDARLFGKPPPFEELVELYEPTTQDLRTDAAFGEGEEFAFLLGEKVATKGWIVAAQWDEASQVMQLWTETHGPYDFPNIDLDAARVFAKADSKGGWFWGVYKGRAVKGAFPKGRRATMRTGKVGVPTPIFKTVIKRRK
jgi:hypothetical protein